MLFRKESIFLNIPFTICLVEKMPFSVVQRTERYLQLFDNYTFFRKLDSDMPFFFPGNFAEYINGTKVDPHGSMNLVSDKLYAIQKCFTKINFVSLECMVLKELFLPLHINKCWIKLGLLNRSIKATLPLSTTVNFRIGRRQHWPILLWCWLWRLLIPWVE